MATIIRPELRHLLQNTKALAAKNPAELCAQVAIALLEHHHGPTWLSSRKTIQQPQRAKPLSQPSLPVPLTRRQQERLETHGCATTLDVLEWFQLKGVAQDAQDGLIGWLKGLYPLDLLFTVPTPYQMLIHQCQGRRFVTLRPQEHILFSPIGRHAGTLEFLLHDLEHAHKFFGNSSLTAGQIAFFKDVKSALDAGFFDYLLKDPQFSAEFDYLMADMNSHPVHLWKYLKAIVLNASTRLGGISEKEFHTHLITFWHWPHDVRDAALRINYPQLETEADRQKISAHFMLR